MGIMTCGSTLISGDTVAEAYAWSVRAIQQLGHEAKPRGTVTRELLHAVVDTPPGAGKFIVIPGRGINHAFSIAETLAIIVDHNQASWLSYYNSRVQEFANEEGKFDGHYGGRLNGYSGDQIGEVIEQLQADHDSRRAVLSIWNEADLFRKGSKDYPCNVMVIFRVVGNELHCMVVRRSSDVIWGVPHDHVVFLTLQEVIASTLGCHVGRMVEVSNSFHYYQGLYDDRLKVVERWVTTELCRKGQSPLFDLGLRARQAPRLKYHDVFNIGKNAIDFDLGLRQRPTDDTIIVSIRMFLGTIADEWWRGALALMFATHLWKRRQYNEAVSLLNDEITCTETRLAAWGTFETRLTTEVVGEMSQAAQFAFHNLVDYRRAP